MLSEGDPKGTGSED